jgi:hypothetical protein
MALYYDLPVYRDTYQLILKIFECTKDFSKEYKYTLGQNMKRDALQTIAVQDLLVQSGGTIHLVAGQTVLLLPGVIVEANGYLRAWIDTDGMYCANAKAIVAASDQPLPEIKFDEALQMKSGIKVYPNPTTGFFILELPETDEESSANVEIYGMMGELIEQITLFGDRSYQFNLSSQARGIYIVRVLQGEKPVYGKGDPAINTSKTNKIKRLNTKKEYENNLASFHHFCIYCCIHSSCNFTGRDDFQ